MNIQDIKTYLLFRMLKDNDYTSYSKYDVIEEIERRFYEKQNLTPYIYVHISFSVGFDTIYKV